MLHKLSAIDSDNVVEGKISQILWHVINDSRYQDRREEAEKKNFRLVVGFKNILLPIV